MRCAGDNVRDDDEEDKADDDYDFDDMDVEDEDAAVDVDDADDSQLFASSAATAVVGEKPARVLASFVVPTRR